jgi:hypothetical protein
MAALRFAAKCSRTAVYAPLLKRIKPCPRKKSAGLKPVLVQIIKQIVSIFPMKAICFLAYQLVQLTLRSFSSSRLLNTIFYQKK